MTGLQNEYGKGTHSHRRSLFRASHRRRFDFATSLLDTRQGNRVLDYGSGDGFLLELVRATTPAAELVALEPLGYLRKQIEARFPDGDVELVTQTSALPRGSFDRIACLEVLEHLQPEAIEQSLLEISRLLKDDGLLVISVPIEIGLPSLLKYVAARVLTGSDRRQTIGEVMHATFGRPVARDTANQFIPHKGFDFRELKRIILKFFDIDAEIYSPLPRLRGFINSQVLWRARQKRASTTL